MKQKRNRNVAVPSSRAAAPVEPALLSVHVVLFLVPGANSFFVRGALPARGTRSIFDPWKG